jgi:hypothetical protein
MIRKNLEIPIKNPSREARVNNQGASTNPSFLLCTTNPEELKIPIKNPSRKARVNNQGASTSPLF